MLRKFFLNTILINTFIFFANDLNASKQFVISPVFETPQVEDSGDADDPAIWLNKSDPSLSIVFGTDKYNGIYSYNLKGEKIGFSKAGSINNIDLRTVGNYTYIFGTEARENNLYLWIYKNSYLNRKSKKGQFSIKEIPHFSGKVNFLAYGLCAGLINNNEVIAFVTEAKGPGIKLWKFTNRNLELINTFNNSDASESEGCVFDDENRNLFISEENERGIIRSYSLSEDLLLENKIKIDDRDGKIVGDPEGLAILKTSSEDGYLIASSQGNSTFNIYERRAPYKFLGSFKIEGNTHIDGVSDTDGLEIINTYLNKDFLDGMLVVQDGNNTGEDTLSKQNFKLLSLSEIKEYLIYQEN
tara:strand:- start:22 stop:1092 length:1071 start_codon:yes stop_codon:yes gene_type:complete